MITYTHPRTFCYCVCEALAHRNYKIFKNNVLLFGQQVACELRTPDHVKADGADVSSAFIKLCVAFAEKHKLPFRYEPLTEEQKADRRKRGLDATHTEDAPLGGKFHYFGEKGKARRREQTHDGFSATSFFYDEVDEQPVEDPKSVLSDFFKHTFGSGSFSEAWQEHMEKEIRRHTQQNKKDAYRDGKI